MNLKQSNYTENSWAAFQTTLKQAESVLTHSNTTQKQVDTALGSLDQSQKSLVKVENKLSGNALPKTGDTNSVFTMSAGALLILIGGIIAYLTRKRRRYTR